MAGRSVKAEDFTSDMLEHTLVGMPGLQLDKILNALEALQLDSADAVQLMSEAFSNNSQQADMADAITRLFVISNPDNASDPSQSSVTNPQVETIVSKLSLPMLFYIITSLVKERHIRAPLEIVQHAIKCAPSEALLQSWHSALQAAMDISSNKTAILADLQPQQCSSHG